MYNVNVHLPNGAVIIRDWSWIPPFDKRVSDNFGNGLESFCIVELSEDQIDVWVEFSGDKQ